LAADSDDRREQLAATEERCYNGWRCLLTTRGIGSLGLETQRSYWRGREAWI